MENRNIKNNSMINNYNNIKNNNKSAEIMF